MVHVSGDLRSTFGEAADLYDRARRGYPDDLFAELIDRSAIGDGKRLLEVGPGTGQATERLVSEGSEVVAVELGASLAGLLRSKLGDAVEVVDADFDRWEPPAHAFDAVLAFTSWHWLDPRARLEHVATALRPGGWLATVTTHHARGGSTAFFTDVQDCYDRWDPDSASAGFTLPDPAAIPDATDEVDSDARFDPAVRTRHTQDISYSTASYLDVLQTYSGHRALAPDRRERLLGCIGALIDDAYGGQITKRYLYELRLARRR